MRKADASEIDGPQDGRRPRAARWRGIAIGVAAAALVGGGTAWLSRERIAADVIDDYLAESGVHATYDIISLTPRQQVIENLVVGDPARPDLTVGRLVISLGAGWAGPEVRNVRVEGARVFASYEGGAFSLGALDPLVFTGSDAALRLPAIEVTIRDARALLASDYGRVALTLDGAGRLDDGFAGTLAATAPGIGTEGCRAGSATLYGQLTTDAGAPELDGPLRLADVACGGASLTRADIGTHASLKPDFSAADADFRIEGGGARTGDLAAAGIGGTAELSWSPGRLALGHDLALTGIAAPQGRLARLVSEGSWRGAADFASGQWEGTVRGTGLTAAGDISASLAAAERGGGGTLIAPLIAQLRTGLSGALDGASFRADAILRHKGREAFLIVPDASLAARSGTRVLALSRTSAAVGSQGLSGLSGNLIAGGAGLPTINARIEQQEAGRWTMRLAMAEYVAGANRIAIPRLALRSSAGGSVAFDGVVTASGDLTGGAVNDLTVPLEGTWSERRGLAMGTRCTPVRFARLAVSGLALDGQAVTLCPDGAAPILVFQDGLTLAARTGPLNLDGTLGENPATISASGAVLRYPQPFAIEGVAARIGTGDSEVRLGAANLTGSLAGEMSGNFTGGSARMAAVPFDLDAMAGRWTFANGALRLSAGDFLLSDRPAAGALARFVPLMAKGASLTLDDNRITADALLQHPESGRSVARVAIAHDLDSAVGNARLTVPGLMFDDAFQPQDLSYLAQGVVALADGTVTGTGRVDWRGERVTSSGTFATEAFDFAAAFGPVRGLSGKVEFTDLINFTTAPDQRVTIAAINPGVEVLAGRVQFELKDGTLLALEDARFPFMGGTLTMRPLVMDFSQPEERRYVFEIVGLDAARFVAQMELTNISATGIFDGTVPVVFDTDGRGRIEGGVLIARAGGGNVAYVGELSYEDLGTMGNYAFSALRSLDYRQMSVGLGGQLDGEIITSFEFDGVRQGAGTSRNFVTRRLAKLPIRFRVNVKSENFYELATMVRSFWDAEYLGDPRSRFEMDEGRLVPVLKPVQPPESEGQP